MGVSLLARMNSSDAKTWLQQVGCERSFQTTNESYGSINSLIAITVTVLESLHLNTIHESEMKFV